METTRTQIYYPSTTALGCQRTEDTAVPINWAIAQLTDLRNSAGSEDERNNMMVSWPVKVYGTHDLTADELKDAKIELLKTTIKNIVDNPSGTKPSVLAQLQATLAELG